MFDHNDLYVPSNYRQIDPEKLVLTTQKMAARVEEDFPGSGLAGVANDVLQIAQGTVDRVEEILKPQIMLRVLVGILVLVTIFGPLLFAQVVKFTADSTSITDFLEATDAGLHMLLLLAGAIIFLVTLEDRLRRNKTLHAISEFRSIAHLIDLHQINKDPGIDKQPAPEGEDTRTVRSDEALATYLDHGGDLLSIIGKLAAYYAQYMQDRVVLDAVNEIETLTSELSQKLWLKILVLRGMSVGQIEFSTQ